MASHLKIGFVCIIFGLAAGWMLSTHAHVTSEAATTSAAASTSNQATWEYTTENVDPSHLNATLVDLGGQGWEVFAVTPVSSQITMGQSQGTVNTQLVTVSAKRPRKR